jgi:hypothetical protein
MIIPEEVAGRSKFNYERLCRQGLTELIAKKRGYSIQEILYSVIRHEARENHTDASFILRIDANTLFRNIEKANTEL